ncbi:hypothetical protein TI04_07715, partial [Achromatium sp. WMS2]
MPNSQCPVCSATITSDTPLSYGGKRITCPACVNKVLITPDDSYYQTTLSETVAVFALEQKRRQELAYLDSKIQLLNEFERFLAKINCSWEQCNQLQMERFLKLVEAKYGETTSHRVQKILLEYLELLRTKHKLGQQMGAQQATTPATKSQINWREKAAEEAAASASVTKIRSSGTVLRQQPAATSDSTVLRQDPIPETVLRQDSVSSGTTLRQNETPTPTATGTVLREAPTATGTVLREAPTASDGDGTVLRQEPVSNPQQPELKQQAPSSAISWEIGATLLDEFRIEKSLGRGGMGEVYLVANMRNEQRFAVKRAYLTQTQHKELFLRELQVWLDLPPYPHILPLRFLRTVGDEQLIFTDYMPGGSLHDWLGTPKIGTLEAVLDFAIQYAWGLHALHELGHVHQDVKPDNALLDAEGILKVADFGLTQTAGAGFTPTYCSPEQYRDQKLTRHTDQWSWGLSVLAMFVGKAPTTTGQNAATALEQYRRNPQQLTLHLPASVAAVLARCFQEQPNGRWPSLQDAATALIKLHPNVCGKPYSRSQPTVTKASERLQVTHDRRVGGVQWTSPRHFLILGLLAAGRDPAEADKMIAMQASSRKGQTVGDLVLYEAAQQIFQDLIAQGKKGKTQEYLARLHWRKAFIYQYLDDIAGQMGALDQSIAIFQHLIKQEGCRE